MLEQKVKDYFGKDPELKILFLFDPNKSYLEEIANSNMNTSGMQNNMLPVCTVMN